MASALASDDFHPLSSFHPPHRFHQWPPSYSSSISKLELQPAAAPAAAAATTTTTTADSHSHTSEAHQDSSWKQETGLNKAARPAAGQRAEGARGKLQFMAAAGSSSSRIRSSGGDINSRRVCRVCFREFPSGYALGGHMRVHGALYAEAAAEKERAAMLKMSAKASSKNPHPAAPAPAPAAPAASMADSKLEQEAFRLETKKRHRSRGSGEYSLAKASFDDESSMAVGARLKQMDWDDDDLEEDEPEEEEEEEEEAEAEEEEEEEEDEEVDEDDDEDEDGGLRRPPLPPQLVSSVEESSSFHLASESSFELLSYGGKRDQSALDDEHGSERKILYKLRRNPRPCQRFADHEFALEDQLTAGYLDFSSIRPSSIASTERSVACSECGKTFLSERALFGHMRCHPDRIWKGAQPIHHQPRSDVERGARFCITKKPPSVAGSSEADMEHKGEEHEEEEYLEEEESMVHDEQESDRNFDGAEKQSELIDEKEEVRGSPLISAWAFDRPTGKRSKRARRAEVAASGKNQQTTSGEETLGTVSTEVETKEDLDMAACLILLSAAGSSDRKPVNSVEADAEDDLGEEEKPEAHFWVEDSERVGDIVPNVASTTGMKFQCSTCKKCFSSPQALGGHRASHRKTKGCFARTSLLDEEVHESGTQHNGTQDQDPLLHQLHKWQHVHKLTTDTLVKEVKHRATPADDTMDKSKGYECSICHRIFPSGQALGGHKRCHWTGEKPVETASAASSNKQTSLLSAGQMRTMEEFIDLNFPPAPMNEEEEVGNSNTELRSIGNDVTMADWPVQSFYRGMGDRGQLLGDKNSCQEVQGMMGYGCSGGNRSDQQLILL